MTYEAFGMSKLDNGFVECGDGTYKKKEVSNEEIVDKVNDIIEYLHKYHMANQYSDYKTKHPSFFDI